MTPELKETLFQVGYLVNYIMTLYLFCRAIKEDKKSQE